jgi:hypothetical protein
MHINGHSFLAGVGEDADATLRTLRLEEDILRINECHMQLYKAVRAGMPVKTAEDYLSKINRLVDELPFNHPKMDAMTLGTVMGSLYLGGEEAIVIPRRLWHQPKSYVAYDTYQSASGKTKTVRVDRTFTYFEHLQKSSRRDNILREGIDAMKYLERVTKPAYTGGVSLQAIIDAETKTQPIPIQDIHETQTEPIPIGETQLQRIPKADPLGQYQKILVPENSYASRGLSSVGRFLGMMFITGMLLWTPVYKSFTKEARSIDYAVATTPLIAYALVLGLAPRKKSC